MKDNMWSVALVSVILFCLPVMGVAANCSGADQFRISYDGFAGEVKTFYERGDNGKFLTEPNVSQGTVTVKFQPDDYGDFSGFIKINSSQDWRSPGIYLSIYLDGRDCSLHISEGAHSFLHSRTHAYRTVCVSHRGDVVRLSRCSL